MRWSLAGAPAPPTTEVLIGVLSTLFLLTTAIVYFRRAEQEFADVV